jgi:soluble lytic murein transglycosylase
MPDTARSYGVTRPFDPEQNLRAGARHLRNLLDQFEGDLTLALAAYNAGAGAVRRHGGVPDYRETRNYVTRVQSRLNTGRVVRPIERSGKDVGSGTEKIRMSLRSDGTVVISN